MKNLSKSILIIITAIAITAEASTSSMKEERVKNTAYKVTGNNKARVSKYHLQRESAIQYMALLNKVTAEIIAMPNPPQGSAQEEYSQMISKIVNDGEVYGHISQSELAHCRTAGRMLQMLWGNKVSDNASYQKIALDMYRSNIRKCKNKIENPPRPAIYLSGPTEQATPPLKDCIEIHQFKSILLERKWLCPAPQSQDTVKNSSYLW